MLVGIAIAVAAACMIGLSAQAVVTRDRCSGGYTEVGVAVSPDIAPAIQTIAKNFNKTRARAGGRCVQVRVTAAESYVTAGEVDGEGSSSASAGSSGKSSTTASAHLPSGIDAWIPDSSLWVDRAVGTPQGAATVRTTNISSVAKSPLMIVTTQTVAAQSQAFAGPVSWRILLPPGFDGPPSTLRLTVSLPSPTVSAVGLATVIEVARQISSASYVRSVFTNFVNDSEATADTDSVLALAKFVSGNTALKRNGVTVASEQAVLAYDKAHPTATPAATLVARYPTGTAKALGSPELNYPYVLTTQTAQEQQAAQEFGTFLLSGYAQSAVRYYGFRSANGVPDAMPSSTGLSSQPLQVATPFSSVEAAKELGDWKQLGLGSRDLALIDVSPVMNAPSGLPGLDVEQVLAATASAGLVKFPLSTHLGQWVIGESSSLTQPPYQQMVSLGGLSQDYGLTTRLQQLLNVDKTLTASTTGNLRLYDAIWDAYTDMRNTYAPNDINAVLVLTAGIDGKGDMTLSDLLSKLRTAYRQQLNLGERPVEVVILMIGTAGNFTAMHEIGVTTGGDAYPVTNPTQIGRIFNAAWAQRLCEGGVGCSTP